MHQPDLNGSRAHQCRKTGSRPVADLLVRASSDLNRCRDNLVSSNGVFMSVDSCVPQDRLQHR